MCNQRGKIPPLPLAVGRFARRLSLFSTTDITPRPPTRDSLGHDGDIYRVFQDE